MKCELKNDCATPNRCCHFCKQKNCWQRCNDNHKGCKWFINEKDEETQMTEDRTGNTHYHKTFKENKQ